MKAHGPSGARILARIMKYGLSWGLAAGCWDMVMQPVAAVNGSFGVFFLSILAHLLFLGVCIAGVADLVDRYAISLPLPLVVIATAVVVPMLQLVVQWAILDPIGLPAYPLHVDPLTSYSYHAWLVLFYGSLLLGASMIAMRTERTRRLLVGAEIERSRSETLLGETQLQALQGRVDPVLLHDVMVEVQRRNRSDPASADRLFEELVGFLRMAMPSLLEGPSTLAAEVALAQAYASLWAEYTPERATWQIEADAGAGEAPFPPLMLLPVLDHFASVSRSASSSDAFASTCSGRGAMRVSRDGESVRILIGASNDRVTAGPLGEALATRLRIGLRTIYPDAWSIDVDPRTHMLSIDIRPNAARAHVPRFDSRSHRVPHTSSSELSDSSKEPVHV